VVIVGRRLQDVKEVCTSVVKETDKMELEMNDKKTKVLIVALKHYNEN
jgi:hypothetical protein